MSYSIRPSRPKLVFWSTRESISNEVLSVSAIVETGTGGSDILVDHGPFR